MPVVTSPTLGPGQFSVPTEPVLQFTVEQYHEMARTGILLDGAPIELLEGWLVRKMTKDPLHALSAGCTLDALADVVGSGWHIRAEGPITTSDSEPEPDVTVVRGNRRAFAERHPRPDEVGLLVEVANTSLERDRGTKKRVYAAAGIPCFWIVNLVDRCVEVYTQPDPTAEPADYRNREEYFPGDNIPVMLDDRTIGTVAVSDLLP